MVRRKIGKRPKKRGILGWILAPFIFLFRVIWAVTWRATAVFVLGIAAWVAYTYTVWQRRLNDHTASG